MMESSDCADGVRRATISSLLLVCTEARRLLRIVKQDIPLGQTLDNDIDGVLKELDEAIELDKEDATQK
jgi:hypothetical protein